MTAMAQRPLLLRSCPPPKSTPSENVAENIRTVFAYKRMTRRDLAMILGVSTKTAGKIWNGRHPITVDHLEKVASAINTPVQRLVTRYPSYSLDVIFGDR